MQSKIDHKLADLFVFKNSKKMAVYNWMYYKEGFSPEIVDYILDKYYPKEKPDIIVDPFCGVGTTLLRSKELGVKSIGLDVSPLAVMVSRVKTRNYGEHERDELMNTMKKLIESKSGYTYKWEFELFPPSVAIPKRNIAFIQRMRASIEEIGEVWIREFFLTALVSIIPQVSLIIKDGGVLKINRNKIAASAKHVFIRKVKRMISECTKIRGPEPDITNKSALDFSTEQVCSNRKSAVITSPPYLNNVDYTKIYGLELSLLGVDTRKLRNQMLDSFIKKRANNPSEKWRYPIVDMYLKNMERVIENISECNGIHIVVGNGVIYGEYIDIVSEIGGMLEKLGFKVEAIEGAIRIANIKPKKTKVGEYLINGIKR